MEWGGYRDDDRSSWFERIFDAAPEAVIATDTETKVRLWNPAAKAMYGWNPSEVIGVPLIDLIAAETSVPQCRAAAVEVLAGARWSGEILSRGKSGNAFLVSATFAPLLDPLQHISGALLTLRDISEQKRAEDALCESGELFRKAFDTEVVAIAISRRRDGMYLEANPGFAKATGYSREEIVGHTSRELAFLSPSQRQALVTNLERHGRLHNQELTYSTKQGEWRTILFSIGPIRVRHEPCLLATMVDITQRKRAEEERNALIQKLEAKNAEQERFLYTVSHDLKTPLISIMGFLALLERDVLGGTEEQVKFDIGRIGHAAEKMHDLLGDLLEYARIGRLVNEPEEVSLGALAREAAETLGDRLQLRGVRVSVDPHLPHVTVDRPRMAEAMQNLIENAVKYMGDQPEPRVEIGMRYDNHRRVFFVRDNGIGIDSHYQEKIFGLFEKLNPAAEGTGVGLTIVKRIIEAHGGSIWVESEGVGKGSTFCFTLSEDTSANDTSSALT